MPEILGDIRDLFARHGADQYGEGVSLENHMVQTALLAEADGGPPYLIVAALLHDIGHFLHPDAKSGPMRGQDLEHEALGAAWLSRGFGPEVTTPIALHVQAKRYLCAVEPAYFDRLSAASRLSLSLQGGPMSLRDTEAFALRPGAADAVRLRRWDDLGKDVSCADADIARFAILLASARAHQPADEPGGI
jgi:gamma-butyrobetaine dioxygenase